jgi:hypothetical protein
MPEHAPHIRTCAGCATFAREVAGTDRDIEDALFVCVPAGLAHRLIQRRLA